jgi:tetratricopeptide (TPR) repeat protein
MISTVGGTIMYRILAAAFFFAVCVSSALAAGYDDFSRGMDANNLGNSDLAISSFTAALADGDLAAAYVPQAYFGRARAYLQKVQCASALADLDQAIKLKPDFVEGYVLRVNVDHCLQKPDVMLADMTAAIGIKPTSVLYAERAVLNWQRDDLPQAILDFDAAGKLSPSDRFLPLWSAAVNMRMGSFDSVAFAKRVEDLKTNAWPGPLLDLYRNSTTPDAVIRAAALSGGDAPAEHKCEADVFIGEWQLGRKDEGAAKASFQAAIVDCSDWAFNFMVATKELKRLK